MLTDVLGAVQPAPTFKRLESVWIGKDNALLDAMFEFYAPSAKRVIDVCCNSRRMWKGSTTGAKVAYYDRDPAMQPDVVAHWHDMPDADGTVDVLVYEVCFFAGCAVALWMERTNAKLESAGRMEK